MTIEEAAPRHGHFHQLSHFPPSFGGKISVLSFRREIRNPKSAAIFTQTRPRQLQLLYRGDRMTVQLEAAADDGEAPHLVDLRAAERLRNSFLEKKSPNDSPRLQRCKMNRTRSMQSTRTSYPPDVAPRPAQR